MKKAFYTVLFKIFITISSEYEFIMIYISSVNTGLNSNKLIEMQIYPADFIILFYQLNVS